jgi:hypothetical protein
METLNMPSLQTKNFTFGTGTSVSTFGLLSATSKTSNTAELSPLGADDVGIVFIKAHNSAGSVTLPTTAAGVPIYLQGSRDNVNWVNVSSFNLGPTNGTGTATVYTNFSNPETNTRPTTLGTTDYISTMGVVQLYPYMRLSWAGSTLTGNVVTGLTAYIGEA